MFVMSCAAGDHKGTAALTGKRIRMSGSLAKAARSLLLTTSNGNTWAVEANDDIVPLFDQQVIIEGTAITRDRIRADWIGPA